MLSELNAEFWKQHYSVDMSSAGLYGYEIRLEKQNGFACAFLALSVKRCTSPTKGNKLQAGIQTPNGRQA
jgi:hypothetical protein